jgi:hypothetical protein
MDANYSYCTKSPCAPLVVHFKGGSLGGETHVREKFELCGNRLRVPVYVPGRIVAGPVGAFSTPPTLQYDYDEYCVERYLNVNEVEMRWIRPPDVSAELALTKTKLADAEEVIDSLKRLKKALNKLSV